MNEITVIFPVPYHPHSGADAEIDTRIIKFETRLNYHQFKEELMKLNWVGLLEESKYREWRAVFNRARAVAIITGRHTKVMFNQSTNHWESCYVDSKDSIK